MKTKNFKKPIALFLAVMLCASLLFSLGTTAFAAEETANVCLIAFPRDGDANYSGEWGHGNLNFMNSWSTKASAFTLIRAMGQYSGNICYCIEPGVSQQPGDSLTKKGEEFWDNYPAAYNKTISPEDIKLLIGRIFQYGYTGPISVSWRSQNDGGDKLAHAVATQLLIWETVVGERDADFNKIGTNGKDAIVDQISTNHPLYDQIMGYYSSIAANVQYHSSIPSFLAKTAAEAQSASLEWDGDVYAVTLTDKNGVLSDYSFSSPNPDIKFSVKGNELTISTGNMLNEPVAITAEKKNSRRSGVITWTDGVYGPNGKLQDTVTYSESCDISNLPIHPRVLSDIDYSRIVVSVLGASSIEEEIQSLNNEYDGLRQLKPLVRDNFDALNTELSETQTQILVFESRSHEINRDLASYDEAIKRLNADLALVNSDIRNNNDAARLQKFGSEATGGDISADICPVCKQHIQDNLLDAEAASGFMSIEDNIRHLKEQKKMLEFTLGCRKESREKLSREKDHLEIRLQMLRRLAHTLRSDLFTTTDTEASEAIMLKRIEISNRIERLSKLQNTIVAFTEQLKELSKEWNIYLGQKNKLPKKDISESDVEKIVLLKKQFIDNLKRYHYSSLSSFDGIDISINSSLLPTIDGFDMKFDSSASDGIRVIWAFTMALLQVSIEKGGNHPGIIIFDEPAQQSIVPEDMKSFIETVVEIKKPFQIITAITLNSQELINIINGLDASSHHTIQIEGKAFKAL